jgi:hydroxyquinol 1,2-dioxygenase
VHTGLDVWQADAEGAYEAQLEVEAHLRGTYRSRDDGTYCVRTIATKGYTIPMDGPDGRAGPRPRQPHRDQ